MQVERISNRCATVFVFASTILVTARVGIAQQECYAVNITQAGSWNEEPDASDFAYADVWGDGDIGYVGQAVDNKLHFIDVSEPSNEVETPPSLPRIRWLESDGSIHRAWWSGWTLRAPSLVNVRPPSSERMSLWPPT